MTHELDIEREINNLDFTMGRIVKEEWIEFFLNLGTTITVAGAILMSFNLGLTFYAYVYFFIGSSSFVVYGYLSKIKQLLIMNFIFSIINLNGLISFY